MDGIHGGEPGMMHYLQDQNHNGLHHHHMSNGNAIDQDEHGENNNIGTSGGVDEVMDGDVGANMGSQTDNGALIPHVGGSENGDQLTLSFQGQVYVFDSVSPEKKIQGDLGCSNGASIFPVVWRFNKIHEMKKSKIRGPGDRLSELPEPLIFHILWFLPMRDVVRTSVLSKHWRNLWTTAPCLNIDYDHIHNDANRIRNFVNRALILWEGIKIQKFKIDLHSCSVDDSLCGDFDFWLRFALRKKVQELYVRNPCDDDESLPLPHNLYSCSSLQVLSLVNCCFEFNGNVQWNQLKSLTISCPFNISEHLISKVLCGSPQLEVFILNLLDIYENLSIQSSSLKRLSISHGEIHSNPSCLDTQLRIWTPNLEILKISGVPYTTCLLKDVSSLTDVNLCIDIEHIDNQIDLLGETLKQVFPTIQHVEKVALSDCCIQVLGDMIDQGLIPSSSNAKFLQLNNDVCANYEQILDVLQIFPKLEILVLKGYCYDQHDHESLKFDANLPESFLLHLRTMDITAGEGDNSVFPFMKIVLENASMLEKMVIRLPSPSPRSNDLFLTSQKLLRMQRSFPAVELMVFYKD